LGFQFNHNGDGTSEILVNFKILSIGQWVDNGGELSKSLDQELRKRQKKRKEKKKQTSGVVNL